MPQHNDSELSNIFSDIMSKEKKTHSVMLPNGTRIIRQGDQLLIRYKTCQLRIEQCGEYMMVEATDKYGMRTESLDFETAEESDIIALFNEWVDADMPTAEEIGAVIGRNFTGKIADIRKYIRFKQ